MKRAGRFERLLGKVRSRYATDNPGLGTGRWRHLPVRGRGCRPLSRLAPEHPIIEEVLAMVENGVNVEEVEEVETWVQTAWREGWLEGWCRGWAKGWVKGWREVLARAQLEVERKGMLEGERKIVRLLIEIQFGTLPDWVIAQLDGATEADLVRWTPQLLARNATLKELLQPAADPDNPAPTGSETPDAPGTTSC